MPLRPERSPAPHAEGKGFAGDSHYPVAALARSACPREEGGNVLGQVGERCATVSLASSAASVTTIRSSSPGSVETTT